VKNLLKSFMLIGLFVFASSSTPSIDAMGLENEVDLLENCLSFDAEVDLLGCDGMEQDLIRKISVFCPYYFPLFNMYYDACITTGNPQDCIKAVYYLSKIESDCLPYLIRV
jgi:hypothetical protein